MLDSFALVVAMLGALGGACQIVSMIRARDAGSQSPLGWAMGLSGSGASFYLGLAKDAAVEVFVPALGGAAICLVGLCVVVYLRAA